MLVLGCRSRGAGPRWSDPSVAEFRNNTLPLQVEEVTLLDGCENLGRKGLGLGKLLGKVGEATERGEDRVGERSNGQGSVRSRSEQNKLGFDGHLKRGEEGGEVLHRRLEVG